MQRDQQHIENGQVNKVGDVVRVYLQEFSCVFAEHRGSNTVKFFGVMKYPARGLQGPGLEFQSHEYVVRFFERGFNAVGAYGSKAESGGDTSLVAEKYNGLEAQFFGFVEACFHQPAANVLKFRQHGQERERFQFFVLLQDVDGVETVLPLHAAINDSSGIKRFVCRSSATNKAFPSPSCPNAAMLTA